MKQLNLKKNKWSTLLVRGISAFSLAIVFLAFPFCNTKKAEHGTYFNMLKPMTKDVATVKTINRNVEEGLLEQLQDNKGNTFLYALLINLIETRTKDYSIFENALHFTREFLKKNEIESDKEKKHKIKKNALSYINLFHPGTGYTLFSRAIRSGDIHLCELLINYIGEFIDINKGKFIKKDDGKDIYTTSLLVALTEKKNTYDNIGQYLLKQPNIDFKTPDPKEYFTPLWCAISNSHLLSASSLALKLSKEDLEKENPYILEMAIKCGKEWEKPVIVKLIPKLPKKALIYLDEQFNRPLDLIVEKGLDDALKTLLPYLDLKEHFTPADKDKKKKGPLHLAARKSNLFAFKEIAQRILFLQGNDYNKLIDILFRQDPKGYTVFASAFLPENKTQNLFTIGMNNLGMFKEVLSWLKHSLTPHHCQNIKKEIQMLSATTIHKGDANKLENIVDELYYSITAKDKSTARDTSPIFKGDPVVPA